LGRDTKDAQAGQVELCGGEVGYVYSQLTFTGKMDADWAKTFFSSRQSEPGARPGSSVKLSQWIETLQDASQPARLREVAATTIGRMGSEAKAAVPALTAALQEKNGRLRVASALALVAIDRGNVKVALPVLREVLKDNDEQAQTAALLAFKTIGPDARSDLRLGRRPGPTRGGALTDGLHGAPRDHRPKVPTGPWT